MCPATHISLAQHHPHPLHTLPVAGLVGKEIIPSPTPTLAPRRAGWASHPFLIGISRPIASPLRIHAALVLSEFGEISQPWIMAKYRLAKVHLPMSSPSVFSTFPSPSHHAQSCSSPQEHWHEPCPWHFGQSTGSGIATSGTGMYVVGGSAFENTAMISGNLGSSETPSIFGTRINKCPFVA
jgi:hypothetical protein